MKDYNIVTRYSNLKANETFDMNIIKGIMIVEKLRRESTDFSSM